MKLDFLHPECLAENPGWKLVRLEGVPYLERRSDPYYFTIQERPGYCDRGNWLALVSEDGEFPTLDAQDGWPRYYFDLKVAFTEIQQWILRRGRKL